MKVTIISGYFSPEQSADVRLTYDLASGFAKRGIETTVIVPFPSRGLTQDQQKEYKSKCYELIADKFQVIRVGKPKKYHQSVFQRGMDFAIKTFAQYRQAKKINTDIYIIMSSPPFLGYIAALLSKKNKVIFKLEDVFPDSLIQAKKMNNNDLLIKILKKAERWVYKKVTRIVADSDDIKRTLIDKGVPESKISVIYDWVDEEKIHPINRKDNYLFDKFGLARDKFYVCYAGNIGLLQNVETIVKAAEIISHKNKQIKVVIIGDGSWKSTLDKILAEGEHDNIFCFPMQPTESIAYVYSLGDIGIVSLKSDITRIALPSKTWDILSAGRPAICEIDHYSCLCKIIKEEKCGFCITPGDAEGMANAILKMFDDGNYRLNAGINGRNYIKNNLTLNMQIKKYIDEIESIIIN